MNRVGLHKYFELSESRELPVLLQEAYLILREALRKDFTDNKVADKGFYLMKATASTLERVILECGANELDHIHGDFFGDHSTSNPFLEHRNIVEQSIILLPHPLADGCEVVLKRQPEFLPSFRIEELWALFRKFANQVKLHV